MAGEKILILESPWSNRIEDTRATKEIYSSAETLLSVHPEPVRIISRPLLTSTLVTDIESFLNLECNQRGPNLVIFSAHGSHSLVETNKGIVNLRSLVAFDGDINISAKIRRLNEKLGRTIILLDACEAGRNIKSFHKASGALGVIGFTESVDWIDSSMFILSLLLKYQANGIFHKRRARKNTGHTRPKAETVIEDMAKGVYKTLAKSLGLEYTFGGRTTPGKLLNRVAGSV